jgi:glycosyltransferase involved in cell wall biosynthesis
MRDFCRAERHSLRDGILLAKPDILHAHWTYEFALACLETGLPTIVTSRDDAFEMLRLSKDLYRFARLLMHVRVLRKAHTLTAVSPYLAKSLEWLSRADIHVVPNAVDVSDTFKINANHRGASLRIATVLNGTGSRKNPKVAIRAFDLFRRNSPDAEMFMYGAGFEVGGPMEQWAAEQRLAENIKFRGPQTRATLHAELKQMSILLHPALEESFGMAILEAMALGIPVVAGSNSGAVPWVLDQGRAGFLTDVTSADAVALSLLTCTKQHEAREERRLNAYERARNLFSAKTIAERYEALYEKTLFSPG